MHFIVFKQNEICDEEILLFICYKQLTLVIFFKFHVRKIELIQLNFILSSGLHIDLLTDVKMFCYEILA